VGKGLMVVPCLGRAITFGFAARCPPTTGRSLAFFLSIDAHHLESKHIHKVSGGRAVSVTP